MAGGRILNIEPHRRPAGPRSILDPKPYPGRGWVHGSKVGAGYANGHTRQNGLFQALHLDAKWMPAEADGGAFGP